MRHIHIPLALLTAAGLAVTPAARAQVSGTPSTALAVGTRVRVTVPGRIVSRRVGTIAAVRGDTLVLRVADREVAMPATSLQQLEVSWGQHSRGEGALRGMVVGLLAGAASGFALAYATTGGRCADCDIVFAAYLTAGALSGTLAGAVLGAANPGERWERIPLQRRATVAPRPGGGIALALTHRF